MHQENANSSGRIYTVQELTREIKGVLENGFPGIRVRGEISNYKRAASGHIYFTLKDEKSVIKVVLFKGYQKNMDFELEDGLKVIVHGSISVFDRRGEYQILADLIEPEGVGALQIKFEQLKKKLEQEGLFDVSRKKKIPPLPDTVGIVTSETGAAIRDILNVLRRRHSGVDVIIYPTLVQGAGAAEGIAGAIAEADRRNETDVLIVGRGGGSIEDLWPFNEEITARAIAASAIPVISAVGHETDFTISDFTADLRAPTPSAAAELVVKSRDELLNRFRDLYRRLAVSVDRLLKLNEERLSRYTAEILQKRVEALINGRRMVLDDVARSLSIGMETTISAVRNRFEKAAARLDVLSPMATLSRGYAVITRVEDGRAVRTVGDVAHGGRIRARVKDGSILGTIDEIEKK